MPDCIWGSHLYGIPVDLLTANAVFPACICNVVYYHASTLARFLSVKIGFFAAGLWLVLLFHVPMQIPFSEKLRRFYQTESVSTSFSCAARECFEEWQATLSARCRVRPKLETAVAETCRRDGL